MNSCPYSSLQLAILLFCLKLECNFLRCNCARALLLALKYIENLEARHEKRDKSH